MQTQEKIKRLLSNNISNKHRDIVNSLKQWIRAKTLTEAQKTLLDNIYTKYFIDENKARKENACLSTYTKEG